MEDESLMKKLCPEEEDGQEEGENYGPCGACDEAKYEVRNLINVFSDFGKRYYVSIT